MAISPEGDGDVFPMEGMHHYDRAVQGSLASWFRTHFLFRNTFHNLWNSELVLEASAAPISGSASTAFEHQTILRQYGTAFFLAAAGLDLGLRPVFLGEAVLERIRPGQVVQFSDGSDAVVDDFQDASSPTNSMGQPNTTSGPALFVEQQEDTIQGEYSNETKAALVTFNSGGAGAFVSRFATRDFSKIGWIDVTLGKVSSGQSSLSGQLRVGLQLGGQQAFADVEIGSALLGARGGLSLRIPDSPLSTGTLPHEPSRPNFVPHTIRVPTSCLRKAGQIVDPSSQVTGVAILQPTGLPAPQLGDFYGVVVDDFAIH
ncbi:MAG: hypothetical protein U1E65_22185 [Myxococcota bacterium]